MSLKIVRGFYALSWNEAPACHPSVTGLALLAAQATNCPSRLFRNVLVLIL